MAYVTKNGWLEHLPTPWDIKCRGLFKIFETIVENPRHTSYDQIEHKYQTFTQIREILKEMGIEEFFTNNDIPPKLLQFAAYYKPETDQYYMTVMVDMPEELKSLYALTFN